MSNETTPKEGNAGTAQRPVRQPTLGERDAAKALARQNFLKERRKIHPNESREALGDAWSKERKDRIRHAMQVLRALQAQGYSLTKGGSGS